MGLFDLEYIFQQRTAAVELLDVLRLFEILLKDLTNFSDRHSADLEEKLLLR